MSADREHGILPFRNASHRLMIPNRSPFTFKRMTSSHLISNDRLDLVLETLEALVDSSAVRLDTVEHQVVLPASVDLVQAILQKNP